MILCRGKQKMAEPFVEHCERGFSDAVEGEQDVQYSLIYLYRDPEAETSTQASYFLSILG